jgi:hypothetical protein
MKQKEYEFGIDPKYHQLVRDQIEGFKKMNEFVENERRRNLPKMTAEESQRIYEELWMIWEDTRKQHPDYKKLDRLRIEEKVERRKTWERIAEGLKALYVDSSL